MTALRALIASGFLLGLVACSPADQDLAEPIEPLGEFTLGFTVVVADNAVMAPPSRSATEEEFETAMKTALQRRFSRFEGDQLYHIAVSVEGYSLAVPGIPLVLNPKSVMIVNATVWDDAAGGKINEEPHQITVLERLSGETAISSGLTQTKEEQIKNLSDNAARLIERWMRQNPEWFADKDPSEDPATETLESAAVEAVADE